ncbi:winged helix-turn-helix transcriptional regulator [Mucilaginibacter sp.]|jgi:DNA-binding HxlR family transcriptional regulator|uniref:winged helix-turn-helix transcriptional regulator n=1 Tax=Mucilaginibacter sp. TaxID=1882438 RepID=UPI0035661CB5
MGTIDIDGNIQEATCKQELTAMRDSLEILGGKWKLMLLRYLSNRLEEKNTFKKIQREIEGLSAKMLAKELKDLELNLLISRSVINTKPVTVEYKVTSYGLNVLPLAENLVQWGLDHRAQIKR